MDESTRDQPIRSGDLAAARALAAAAALATFGIVPFLPQIFVDGDTYWHVSAGEWILRNRAVPHADPFSATFGGQPWTAHEWLSEVLMALAYRAAGWNGVALLTGACAAAGVAALALHLRRLAGSTLAATALLAVACSTLLCTVLARPHMLALPLLVAWCTGLLRARAEDRTPSLLLLPLMVLWANLHGGFAAGFALALPLAAEAVLMAQPSARIGTAMRWIGFIAAAVGAALVTPHGIEGLVFPIKLMRMESLASIQEWRGIDFAVRQPFEFFLLTVLAVVAVGRPRLPVLRLIVLMGLIHAALGHGRNQALAGIIGTMLLAEPFGGFLLRTREEGRAAVRDGIPDGAQVTAHDAGPGPWVLPGRFRAAAALAVAVLLAGARLAVPIVRDDPVTPEAALLSVPPEVLSQPVFNEYALGGYLIFRGVRPFIDGRTDMYGDAFMAEYADMTACDGLVLAPRLDARGVAWTILAPANRAVAALDKLPGWKRVHADENAVVHIRTDVTPEHVAGR